MQRILGGGCFARGVPGNGIRENAEPGCECASFIMEDCMGIRKRLSAQKGKKGEVYREGEAPGGGKDFAQKVQGNGVRKDAGPGSETMSHILEGSENPATDIHTIEKEDEACREAKHPAEGKMLCTVRREEAILLQERIASSLFSGTG